MPDGRPSTHTTASGDVVGFGEHGIGARTTGLVAVVEERGPHAAGRQERDTDAAPVLGGERPGEPDHADFDAQ